MVIYNDKNYGEKLTVIPHGKIFRADRAMEFLSFGVHTSVKVFNKINIFCGKSFFR